MARQKSTDQQTAPKGLSVFERRLANPLGRRTRQIPLAANLKNEWTLREFTADPEHEDRHYEAVHEFGYTPCKPEDLGVDPRALGLSVNAEGFVVRGAKGQSMLMRIPKYQFDAIQKAKSEANLAGVRRGKLKDEVAQATAKEHGSEAGDVIHKHYHQEDVVGPVGG